MFDTQKAATTDCVSVIDYNVTMADLHVAEAALREEPYPRLPALAGTLAIAAMRFEQLRNESMALRAELKRWQTTRCQCIQTQIEETGMNERQKNLPSTCGECGQRLSD